LKQGNAAIDQALQYMTTLEEEGESLPPLEWSEGLSKVASDYADAWSAEDDASKLKKRMKKYGKFSSSAEY